MPPHTLCLLVYDRLCTFEFALAAELFGDRSAHFGQDWYRLRIAAIDAAPVTGTHGVRIDAESAEALHCADTIVIPGWRMGAVPDAYREYLRAAHARGCRIASICTGAFVLAACGLLDGRRAATHWRYAAALAEAYPAVRVDPDVLYIDDGDILTSAGAAAGIDLMLHMVRHDFGVEKANAVARSMVVAPHRAGGQKQFIDRKVDDGGPSAFSELMARLRADPAQDIDVAAMANMAAMSKRSFFRRFRAATGATPHEWLLGERVRLAAERLETSDEPMEVVAHRAGFASAELLRYHFLRANGVTPTAWRSTFRSPNRAGASDRR